MSKCASTKETMPMKVSKAGNKATTKPAVKVVKKGGNKIGK